MSSGKKLKIEAGSVFHLWCGHCRDPKWKFHVVAYVQPQLRYFLINTRPAAFQRADASLMAHQVDLLEADHEFLSHDSVLDCSQVVGGPTASELEDLFLADEGLLLGRLATNCRRTARRVVQASDLLSPKEIAAILAIW